MVLCKISNAFVKSVGKLGCMFGTMQRTCDRSDCITVHFQCCPFFNSTCTVEVSLQIVSQVAFETPREEPKDLRVVSISFLFHRHHTLSFKSSASQKKKKKVQQKRGTRLQASVSIKTPPVTQSLHNATCRTSICNANTTVMSNLLQHDLSPAFDFIKVRTLIISV